jgi:[acyl-carrier-protein] S-malonyltransferase
VTAANINGAGQIVAAGSVDSLTALLDTRPDGVTKILSLKVAGAFHTGYMAPAEQALKERAGGITVNDPVFPLLSNADGAVVTSGAEVLARLIAQVTLPVRWDKCMATLDRLGVTATVELPPARALTGLVKRELKGITTVALQKPADLDRVAELLAAAAADEAADATTAEDGNTV